MRAALRLLSVKIDFGDLRRAFGRLRRLWRLDGRGARRRRRRRDHAEIDMFTRVAINMQTDFFPVVLVC